MSKMKNSGETRSYKRNNSFSERTPTKRRAGLVSDKAQTLPRGMARHTVTVKPATSFEYRYKSAAGRERVIHLERGALETRGGSPQTVLAFRAGVSPLENPTRGGFFTDPDSIPLSAEASILIRGGVSGDSIVCRSFGSFDGLNVTLAIFRENSDGSIERILREDIQDADEHTFLIP
jgi:hypothetical protein